MEKVKAIIVDLDGVITQTASVHARAWKEMFDRYNSRRETNGKEKFRPFSIRDDYPEYLDGMPRYEGVSHFLHSRDIEIPWGDTGDEAGKETVCGLGNWKNEIFQEKISEEGVEVFRKNVNQLKVWKEDGFRMAVISSSRNCKKMLNATGLSGFFEVIVDGIKSAELNLRGKPAPDIFLEAAKGLGVDPQEAMIIEDSLAGVEAGCRGNFRKVVGIAGSEKADEMRKRGADIVVESLDAIHLRKNPERLESALQAFHRISSSFDKEKLIIFFDYDGTLTPIVNDYQKAFLSDDMRKAVKKLADRVPVAVISGRGLADVKERVGLERVYYVGSHGFEISGPGGFEVENEEAKASLPDLEALEKALGDELKDVEGVRLERKKFALAVHYRNVPPEQVGRVKDETDQAIAAHDHVRKGTGKKVIEIRPDVDWHKGKAIEMITQKLFPQERKAFALYLGDDITDEDAFRHLKAGAGILVGTHGQLTYADFRLKDPDEVLDFIRRLTEHLKI